MPIQPRRDADAAAAAVTASFYAAAMTSPRYFRHACHMPLPPPRYVLMLADFTLLIFATLSL